MFSTYRVSNGKNGLPIINNILKGKTKQFKTMISKNYKNICININIYILNYDEVA